MKKCKHAHIAPVSRGSRLRAIGSLSCKENAVIGSTRLGQCCSVVDSPSLFGATIPSSDIGVSGWVPFLDDSRNIN